MNRYIDTLRHLVDENPPNYGDGDATSILEMLFTYCHECNNTDTDAIKVAFEDLYPTDARYAPPGDGSDRGCCLHPLPGA